MPQPSLRQQLLAEALGTAVLVATVVGSGIMAEHLTADLALQLLANTLPTVAILAVLITVLAPVCGAHFNPAVTLVMVLRRETTGARALGYIAAQIAGGVSGTVLAHAMFDLPLIGLSVHARTGAGEWLAEVVATGGLVLTILLGRTARPTAVPALVALYIGAAYWFTSSTSFANPAVTLARAFTPSFSGIALANVPAFVLAQLCGAAFGLVLSRALMSPANKVAP